MNKIVFKNPWFNILEIQRSETSDQYFYGVKPKDYVTAAAYDQDGNLLLVSQYRPIIDQYTLETPGGHVDECYTPEQAIKIELKEEIGLTFNSIKLLAILEPDVGRLMNKLYVFEARLPKNGNLNPEQGITIEKVQPSEMYKLITNSVITSAYTISAIYLSMSNYESIK